MAEQFAGKYTFVSQDNFGEYLKAAGMYRLKISIYLRFLYFLLKNIFPKS